MHSWEGAWWWHSTFVGRDHRPGAPDNAPFLAEDLGTRTADTRFGVRERSPSPYPP
jgi:hypothetical protein